MTSRKTLNLFKNARKNRVATRGFKPPKKRGRTPPHPIPTSIRTPPFFFVNARGQRCLAFVSACARGDGTRKKSEQETGRRRKRKGRSSRRRKRLGETPARGRERYHRIPRCLYRFPPHGSRPWRRRSRDTFSATCKRT